MKNILKWDGLTKVQHKEIMLRIGQNFLNQHYETEKDSRTMIEHKFDIFLDIMFIAGTVISVLFIGTIATFLLCFGIKKFYDYWE